MGCPAAEESTDCVETLSGLPSPSGESGFHGLAWTEETCQMGSVARYTMKEMYGWGCLVTVICDVVPGVLDLRPPSLED